MKEFERLSNYLIDEVVLSTNTDYASHTDESCVSSFKKRGFTNSGSQCYQYKLCGKSFTINDKSRKHRRPEIKIRLFDLILLHVLFRNIAKHLDVSPNTLYDKIDSIHKQCLKLVAECEQQLIDEKLKEKSLYLATDRQVQTTNWIKRENKRNTEL